MKIKVELVQKVKREVEVEVEFPFYYRYSSDNDGPDNYDVRICLTASGKMTVVTENTTNWGQHESWEVQVETVDVAVILADVLTEREGVLSGDYYRSNVADFNDHYHAAMRAILEAGE